MRLSSFTSVLVAALLLAAPALAGAQDPHGNASRDLARAVEPLWIDLTDSQREILKPFEPQWNTWTSDEKRVWVVLANRFPSFSARAKSRAMKRIHQWAQLTPAERDVARHNYQLARERSKAERRAEWQQYQQMTPEQQSVLRANGTISNTAAGAAPPSGLARDAAKPLAIQPVLNNRLER